MLRVEGTKILALMRNYAAHAKEMGAKSAPTLPVAFLKPLSSIVLEGSPIVVPNGITEIHHELELGVVISHRCKDVSRTGAMGCVAGYVLALDMTAREMQQKAKESGSPWTFSKGFDTFCPISRFIPAREVVDVTNLDLWLDVDGLRKQTGNTKDMIHSVPDIIAHLSTMMTLEAGDIILTGTPEGVGPVKAGQVITAGIKGLVEMRFPVVAANSSRL